MKYKIKNSASAYSGFLSIKKAELEYDSFIPGKTVTAVREMMDRGDSIAVVLFEKNTQTILLTNQFRYPIADKDKLAGYSDAGWLLELPAGGINEKEDPKEAAMREVEEELGYIVNSLKFISMFYASPGGTSERIFLYYTEVNSVDKQSQGGGVKNENEDIWLYKLPKSEIYSAINDGRIRDAKSIIGLLWLEFNGSFASVVNT